MNRDIQAEACFCTPSRVRRRLIEAGRDVPWVTSRKTAEPRTTSPTRNSTQLHFGSAVQKRPLLSQSQRGCMPSRILVLLLPLVRAFSCIFVLSSNIAVATSALAEYFNLLPLCQSVSRYFGWPIRLLHNEGVVFLPCTSEKRLQVMMQVQ